MAVFKRDRAFVDICLEMLHDDSSCNLSLYVPGSGEPPIPVHQAFVCQLGPLVRECLLTIGPEVEAALLFPEFSVDEVQTLISFLYRGQEGRISQSLAHAMGLTFGGHGIKGLLRNNRRRPQAAAAAIPVVIPVAPPPPGNNNTSDDDDKKEATILARSDNGLEPGKFEADIKLELADYEDNESCNGGGMSGGGGALKLFQPKCELSEDQLQQQHDPNWHWNKAAGGLGAKRAESSDLLVHKKMRKKRSSLMMGVKDEEDWEGPVRRRKKKRRVGPNCASPKSKLVEYHQVRGYLLLLF